MDINENKKHIKYILKQINNAAKVLEDVSPQEFKESTKAQKDVTLLLIRIGNKVKLLSEDCVYEGTKEYWNSLVPLLKNKNKCTDMVFVFSTAVLNIEKLKGKLLKYDPENGCKEEKVYKKRVYCGR